MIKVKLEDMIEQFELVNEETQAFLNLKTGEIHLIPDEITIYIENDEFDENDLPEWEKEIIPIAKDIQENTDNYISFPTQFDINEYQIMERFSLSLTNEELRDGLYYAIKGRGAFRMFRDKIREYGLEDEWYKFKENTLKRLAIEWCKANNIETY